MSDSEVEIENDPKINIFRQCSKSPIDINVLNAMQIKLPDLKWMGYEQIPQKMQLENSGETLILMPEWQEGTPSVRDGPFDENYVFSRIHFHWGSAINGSEHTVDGIRMPLEMHAIHYKKEYPKLEIAKKYHNGILILVYFLELKSNHNPVLDRLLSKLPSIQKADTKVFIEPFPMEDLLKPFVSDYYTYYGSIATWPDPTPVAWIINRRVTAISPEQLRLFHQLRKPNEVTIYDNCRKANPFKDQLIFHVNPPYQFINSTLSPIPILYKKQYE